MSSIGEGIDFSQEQQKISGTLLMKRGKRGGLYCSVVAMSVAHCVPRSVWPSSEWPTPELLPHWPEFPRWLWYQLVMKIWPLCALFTTLAVWG